MEIDLTRLRYFLTVAEERHFKHAADLLHITAPPLSKQIKLLEAELGGSLFERAYHKVTLTPLGESLVDPVRDILRRVDELKSLTAVMTHQAIPLRLGATGYAPSEYLDIVQEVMQELPAEPEASFTISGSSAEVIAQLISGHLELGLIHIPSTDERVDTVEVISYRSGIAVRSDDPLALRDSVTLDDIKHREIAIDFSRANPHLFANLERRMSALGFDRVVRATQMGRASELELAAQTRARHLVTLVAYAPHSSIGRIFSAPDFAMVPIDDAEWEPGAIGLAWSKARVARTPELERSAKMLAQRISAH